MRNGLNQPKGPNLLRGHRRVRLLLLDYLLKVKARDLVADDDATSIQSAVPAHAEVMAIDRGAGGKTRPGLRPLS